MQQEPICLCCGEDTKHILGAVVIPAPDFDLCGQEFDPIVTDRYDIIGFEDHCPNCRDEFSKQRDAYASSDDLPF
jgi:hypothetical protein